MSRSAFLGSAAILLLMQPAPAAELTASGARALQDTLELYLGKPAAGETGAVEVATDGAAYRVTVDIQKLAKPLAGAGVEVGPATVSFHATPQDDGKWRVNDYTLPASVSLKGHHQSILYSFDNVQFDGLFDPSIAGFEQSTFRIGGMGATTVAPKMDVTVGSSDSDYAVKGKKIADGVADVALHQTMGAFTETVKAHDDPTLGAFGFTIKSGTGGGDVAIDAFHSAGLLDIWAYLLAHDFHVSDAAAAEGLRSRVLALLPVFTSAKESATLNDVAVETSTGSFSAKQTFVELGFAGIVPEGHLGFAWRTNGLSIPPNLLPDWQKQLVPTDFDISFEMHGFDLDAAAKELIADLDFIKGRVDPAAQPKITEALLKGGPAKMTIPSSHIVSPALDVEFHGEVTVASPLPLVHVDVTAKGVEQTIAMLTTSAAGDQMAQGLVGVLGIAQKLAKPGADNALTWAIDLGPDGTPVINGTPLSNSSQPQ